jgi:hypothetical protein
MISDPENRDNVKEGHLKDISIYGGREKIFKESEIMRFELDEMAKVINGVYSKSDTPETMENSWQNLDMEDKEKSRASADFFPQMCFLVDPDMGKVLDRLIKGSKENDPLIDILAETEHLRFNAHLVSMGYKPATIQDMKKRITKIMSENSDKETLDRELKKFHTDKTTKEHACLVPWEDLKNVSRAYTEELSNYNVLTPDDQHFQNKDKDIVVNFTPKFIEAKNKPSANS